jgi:hypothetical protein
MFAPAKFPSLYSFPLNRLPIQEVATRVNSIVPFNPRFKSSVFGFRLQQTLAAEFFKRVTSQDQLPHENALGL